MSILKQRLHVTIRGAVQGVGFRPFIYRLATELGLVGWVNNSAQGVHIQIEGCQKQLQAFLLRIEQEKPSFSRDSCISWAISGSSSTIKIFILKLVIRGFGYTSRATEYVYWREVCIT